MSDRLSEYKHAGRTSEARRQQRAQEGVQLRKQKRDEQVRQGPMREEGKERSEERGRGENID